MSELPIKRSETIGALVGALATAQANFGPLVKTHENTYTGKKYADLADVIAATLPALAKNGLAVIQVPIRKDGAQEAGALSILAHSSGESISVELILPATMKAKDGASKFDQQSIGAAITYARRYTWQSLVGVAAEDDDDGNSATDRSSQTEQVAKPKVVKAPPVSQKVSNQGGERPNDSKYVPNTFEARTNKTVQPPTPPITAPPANDPIVVETFVVPQADINPDTNNAVPASKPVESTSSQTEQPDIKADKLKSSEKPTKAQFDAYTARAVDLKV